MKQHAVPKSYLARWFDRDSRRGKPRAPVNAFRTPNQYTDQRAGIGNPLWLEHGFGKIEGHPAKGGAYLTAYFDSDSQSTPLLEFLRTGDMDWESALVAGA